MLNRMTSFYLLKIRKVSSKTSFIIKAVPWCMNSSSMLSYPWESLELSCIKVHGLLLFTNLISRSKSRLFILFVNLRRVLYNLEMKLDLRKLLLLVLIYWFMSVFRSSWNNDLSCLKNQICNFKLRKIQINE